MTRAYVEISRKEIEEWLNKLPHKWSRKQGRAGIYYVRFSNVVGCSVSTTIGRADKAVGRARGSMALTLVSLVTGQTLNRKAKDRKHFQRTINWRKTWAEGVKHWLGVYQKAAGFYDKIAPIKDRDKYKTDTLSLITSVPNWEADRMLSSFHQQVEKGSILSDKQRAIINSTSRQPSPNDDGKTEDDTYDYWLNVSRDLYRAARRRRHEFGMGIAQSVGQLVKAGRNPSEKQWRAFLNMLDQAGVDYDESKVPKVIAKRLAASVAALITRYAL